MFSKALFKQSIKANWVKWISVTTATCIMLAIVIIVLGNLGINDIRDSLKDVFVQADQESQLKEQAVDGYELYVSSATTYPQLHNTMVQGFIQSIISDYQTQLDTLQGQGDISAEQKQQLMQQIANQYAENLDSIAMGTKEYKASFFYNSLFYYDTNSTSLDYDDLIDYAYLTTVYDMAYAQFMAGENATNEEAVMKAIMAKTTAQTAISKYKELGENANYQELGLQYMNTLMYDSTYNLQIQQGVSADDAKLFAVSVKVISNTAITSYQFWLNEGGDVTKEEARANACQSISDQIPEKVSEALTELGNMDMYSLIIGSIFYRIAGLLLPMVFVIMAANGLLAGQVDSGSMAYVLSTPTKRRTVAITQMVYLVTALFSMFALLTAVSVIAVFVSGGNDFAINYGQILLFNLGAYLTMFAIAGFCYMCSSIFNRTKYSLGLGGGLTIFSLVCTILGLFGSTVVPSAMRIEPMNFFNYLSIITLFDTNEIMLGSLDYIWKFAILLGIGLITFMIGVFRFEKKDLPL